MLTKLAIFATLCAAAAFVIWWRTPGDIDYMACEERDAYIASLWTGSICFGFLFILAGVGLVLVGVGVRMMIAAVNP